MLKLIKTIFLFFLLFTLGFASQEIIIEARASKKQVMTGQVFQYTAKIEGTFIKPKIDLPKFNGFRIVGKQQSKSYSGKGAKLTIFFKYSLFAEEPGKFVIAPIIIKDSNKKYKSKPISIEVIGESLQKKRKLIPYIKRGKNI